jgi:flagellar hook protein FlgE
MLGAFSIALSGLSGTSAAVDAIGNNLANMNTPGYKTTVMAFQDMVTQAIAGSAQSGAGIGMPTVFRQFTQGAVQASGGPMDAAIQGQGFFVVRDPAGQMFYTRAGNFHLDASGHLLTASGQMVQGWSAVKGTVNTTGATGNMTLPVGALRAPTATTTMSADLNLDSGTAKDGQFSTPVEVVDALGAKHVVTMSFTNNGDGSWNYAASVPGEALNAGTPGTPSLIDGASGTLTFDDTGKLKTTDPASGTVPIKISGMVDGAAELDITWSFLNTDGSPRVTQYGQASTTSNITQDGFPAGQLTGVTIADGGTVVGQYSNGQQQVIGQLALASIRNPESMIAVGGNNLALSIDTAAPVIGESETGARGKIVGGALENSTVDMAREFTNLIVMERSYQADARVITTSDEMSQETVNLKR